MASAFRRKRCLRFLEAVRTSSPVANFGLVYLIASAVPGFETRRPPNRAVYIHHAAADATDEMVMVVTDTILVAGRRARWLNTSDEVRCDQDIKCVVHRLQRNRADFCANGARDDIRRDVRSPGDRPEHRNSLSCYLYSTLSKRLRRITEHSCIVDQILE